MSTAINSEPMAPPEVAQASALSADGPQPLAVSQSNGSNLHVIALSAIVPSKTNPRQSFDGDDMRDLVESIKVHGVLQPVLVRPIVVPEGEQLLPIKFHDDEEWCVVSREEEENITESEEAGAAVGVFGPRFGSLEAARTYCDQANAYGKFELVCGERRYRASREAGLDSIPCVVRELTDTEALEIQIVENLQRKDVSPLEEAQGYKRLLDTMAAAQPEVSRKSLVGEIAQRVGKSTRYVYQRMQLVNITGDAQEALRAGKITASHAELLVRLDEEDQEDALGWLMEEASNFCAGYKEFSADALPSIRDFKQHIEFTYNEIPDDDKKESVAREAESDEVEPNELANASDSDACSAAEGQGPVTPSSSRASSTEKEPRESAAQPSAEFDLKINGNSVEIPDELEERFVEALISGRIRVEDFGDRCTVKCPNGTELYFVADDGGIFWLTSHSTDGITHVGSCMVDGKVKDAVRSLLGEAVGGSKKASKAQASDFDDEEEGEDDFEDYSSPSRDAEREKRAKAQREVISAFVEMHRNTPSYDYCDLIAEALSESITNENCKHIAELLGWSLPGYDVHEELLAAYYRNWTSSRHAFVIACAAAAVDGIAEQVADKLLKSAGFEPYKVRAGEWRKLFAPKKAKSTTPPKQKSLDGAPEATPAKPERSAIGKKAAAKLANLKPAKKADLTPEQLASMPVAPGSTKKKAAAKKSSVAGSKSSAKTKAKPAKKAAKKGGRK